MNLSELLTAVSGAQITGEEDFPIKSICFDSREVQQGCLFVAIRGTQTDGHQYITKAIENGARAIVAETEIDENQQVAWIKVSNSAKALGQLAAKFYGHPSRQLQLVGITGTNGKTTTATLLFDLMDGLGYKTGLLSTVENRIGRQKLEATHTTGDALQINALLAQMVEAGCEYAFMEVSSHAIDQDRIEGLAFRGAVFTNLSHDHLDYHGTFKAYINAKKKFFDNLPKQAFALVNIDDKRGEVMLQNTAAEKIRYSLRTLADFRCKVLENSPVGLHLELDGVEVFTRIIGGFNAYNLLATYVVARQLGHEKNEILSVLSGLHGAEGRVAYVKDPKGEVTAVVDYAHTPDALEKVIETLRAMLQPNNQLITVVGCGGDRDKAKRPVMAKIAAKLSNKAILTSDNPRTEDPAAILNDMEEGIENGLRSKTLRIQERMAAIQTACHLAQSGDLILVAGKGHEKYQEINGVKHPFDDMEVLEQLLKER